MWSMDIGSISTYKLANNVTMATEFIRSQTKQ